MTHAPKHRRRIDVDAAHRDPRKRQDVPRHTPRAAAEVEPASFAEDINFGRGDVITEINRTPIYSVADYRKAVSTVKPGDDITFKVLRRQDGDRMLTLYLSGRVPSDNQH